MDLVLQKDPHDLYAILAAFYFPEDPGLREEYLSSREWHYEVMRVGGLIAQEIDFIKTHPRIERTSDFHHALSLQNATDSLVSLVDELLPMTTSADALTKRRPAELQENVNQSLKEALIAGETFSMIYGMHVEGIEEPSKSKALWLMAQEYELSETQIRKYWRRYSDIIHLCSAYSVYVNKIDEAMSDPNSLFPSGLLIELVSLSRALWEWGMGFIDRNGRPLLTANSWVPPEGYALSIPVRNRDTGELTFRDMAVHLEEPFIKVGFPFQKKLENYQKK